MDVLAACFVSQSLPCAMRKSGLALSEQDLFTVIELFLPVRRLALDSGVEDFLAQFHDAGVFCKGVRIHVRFGWGFDE